MPFDVTEIRERARRLKRAVALERYEVRAGLKDRSSFREIYDSHRFLLLPQVLPAIQRQLTEAEGDERRRLLALFAWLSGQQVEAELAPFEDELRAWEAGATVSLRDQELPLRRVPVAIAHAENRGERLAWEAARNARLEEAAALQLDILHREREAVAELGLGDYVEARERLAGFGLRALERNAIRIIAATEAPYREAFLREVGGRLRIEARAAARSDAMWLIGMRWLSASFGINALLGRVRDDLEDLGLPLRREGVRIDLDRRAHKESQSFCAAIRVPGDVVISVAPGGGGVDARNLLHEVGHALHFSYTSAGLPWEDRALGDTSVTEAFAILFESLTLEEEWAATATDLSGADLEEYLSLSRFLHLYRLRRRAAEFLYEMELAATTAASELTRRYVELLGQTTGFAHDPQTHIEDIRRGFWVARQLRAAMLASLLRRSLRQRFGEAWIRQKAAGAFLAELMSAGQRENATQVAAQLGEDSLSSGPLIEESIAWVS